MNLLRMVEKSPKPPEKALRPWKALSIWPGPNFFLRRSVENSPNPPEKVSPWNPRAPPPPNGDEPRFMVEKDPNLHGTRNNTASQPRFCGDERGRRR